jgi:hypothetical protein
MADVAADRTCELDVALLLEAAQPVGVSRGVC